MPHFALVALWDRDGRLLVQERDAGAPSDPLRWGLPGGSREGDETPLDNALRELREETGLHGIDLHEIATLPFFSRQAGAVEFAVLGAGVDLGDDDVECHEGRQMVFRDVAGLWALDLTRSSALALRHVLRHPPYVAVAGEVDLPPQRRFAGVVLVDRRGWILLQERDEHPRIDPEKWGLAGGHVDEGEEFEAAAHRELEEETGVRLPAGSLRLVAEFTVDHRAAYGTWDRMQVFAAAVDLADDDIDCREGRQIVFVDPDVALGLDLSSAAADIVPAFLRSAQYLALKEQP